MSSSFTFFLSPLFFLVSEMFFTGKVTIKETLADIFSARTLTELRE